MSEPFVGEIRMFAGNFAPNGWAFCDGQLLAISQNDTLFSLIGTTYGGDGTTTFGLPDCRGRVPVHAGTAPGLSDRRLGSKGGSEIVTLTVNQLPSHTHSLQATANIADEFNPSNNVLAVLAESHNDIYISDTADSNMSSIAISQVGGSESHTNIQPFLCINFIISLFGIFPSST